MLWEFSIVSSLSGYSILVQHTCNDRAWLTSECSPRYDNLLWENRRDSRHVTSSASWVYIMPRIKNSQKKIAGVLNAIRDREEVHGEEIVYRIYSINRPGQPSAVIARGLNKNAVSWQTRNNRNVPKQKLSQNAKNLQSLLKFGLMKDNVTVFQWPWNSESG